jgi:membrane protein
MVWIYLSGFVFVLGGTVNAILEHASRTGKAQGARDQGTPAPPPRERPSAVPPGVTATATVAARSSSERPHPPPSDPP